MASSNSASKVHRLFSSPYFVFKNNKVFFHWEKCHSEVHSIEKSSEVRRPGFRSQTEPVLQALWSLSDSWWCYEHQSASTLQTVRCYTSVLTTLSLCSSILAGAGRNFFRNSGSGYFLEILYCGLCVFGLKHESPEEQVANLFLHLKNVEP